MAARVIMIQGTGSHVGKSLIVAGLCRAFANAGLSVAPFKPQNMSNNAAATADGGEMGRAQALQAQAARRAPVADMNPVLLKPESAGGAQVIVQGRRAESMSARDYFRRRMEFMPAILDSFQRLCAGSDIVIVEGAGSPAEVNLRQNDLANMGFAEAVDAPVLLLGDIHRGGVMAAIVGTLAVLPPEDAARIRGFIINNFHGDPALFTDGMHWLEERTALPCLGVVPHFADAALLPAEDSQALELAAPGATLAAPGATLAAPAAELATLAGGQQQPAERRLRIAVPRLPRMANFDDLDPLRQEPAVDLRIIPPGEPLPGNADLVILPGSKAVIDDLAFIRRQGWDIDILAHARRGGRVLGICGGYQMLGRVIRDPHGVEGEAGRAVEGLGLLAVETELTPEKITAPVLAEHVESGEMVKAYEIHLGRTTGADCARPFARIKQGPDAQAEHCMHEASHRPARVMHGGGQGAWREDGATSADGRIIGTYLHGAFTADGFRRAFLAALGAPAARTAGYRQRIEQTLDALAEHLAQHMDLEQVWELARPPHLP